MDRLLFALVRSHNIRPYTWPKLMRMDLLEDIYHGNATIRIINGVVLIISSSIDGCAARSLWLFFDADLNDYKIPLVQHAFMGAMTGGGYLFLSKIVWASVCEISLHKSWITKSGSNEWK